jgi:hypothetical protein
MKGLELARAYYEEHGKPMLLADFPAYAERIAAGLVGQGSECFGFDDELSVDHDFGPAFCLWLPGNDYAVIGSELAQSYAALPKSFQGYQAGVDGAHSAGRTGVQSIGDFYRRHVGSEDGMFSLMGWLHLPESALAAATNGEVFADPLGEFSLIRERLLQFYPEDVRLKKLAARAAHMAQSGQYNYARCMCRGETVAAFAALAEFIRQTISMVYLLNKKYMPFYKWMHRGMKALPILGEDVGRLLSELSLVGIHKERWRFALPQDMLHVLNTDDRNVLIVEEICALIKKRLHDEGLAHSHEDFLAVHADEIQSRIGDPGLRALHVTEG